MQTVNKGERYVFIDHLKFIAIVCVALCHSVEGVYTHNEEVLSCLTEISNLFRISTFTIGRTFGVPFFLMISGYLLLDRFYDNERMKRFYTNNWMHLIICTMVWFLIYDLYVRFYMHGDISWMGFVKDVLFLQKPGLSHQWYMPMIIGFYAMIPFAANALNRTEGLRMLWIPYTMVFLYDSAAPFLGLLLEAYGKKPLSPQIDMGFTGGVFGLYLISGYMVKKGMLRKIPAAALACISVSGIAVQIAFWYWGYRNGYIVWYDSPFVILASVAAFEAASRGRKWKQSPFVVFLAKNAFAVYLIHMLIRNLSPVRQAISVFREPVQAILLTVIILTASYCLAWAAGKTKAGRYLLYLK